jgi:hypothetical protein
MPEWLLDDDPRVLREAGVGEPFHDRGEERGRNLEVEDRGRHALDRLADRGVRGVVAEVALHVAQALREPGERRVVHLRTRVPDRVAGALAQLLVAQVVLRDADHGARQPPPPGEQIERLERHLPRQVAGDPEDHQGVGILRGRHGRSD